MCSCDTALLPPCFRPALKVYQQKEWVLRSWRDVFVDLVQGQLQHLFLSLLSGEAPYSPSLDDSAASSVCWHMIYLYQLACSVSWCSVCTDS